jgi:hypothetical protein
MSLCRGSVLTVLRAREGFLQSHLLCAESGKFPAVFAGSELDRKWLVREGLREGLENNRGSGD